MVRAAFAHQHIGDGLIFLLLHQLLQRGLIVPVVELCVRDIHQHEPVHKLLRGLHAAVQIAGGDHRLHCVRQDRIPASSAAGFLTLTQQQMLAQADLAGHRSQRPLADHIRPHPGQFALGTVGEIPVQMIRHQHTKNGISQKFQALIAHQAAVPAFVGIGGVGQRILQQGDILEPISNGSFQILKHFRSPSPLPDGAGSAPVHR